MCLGVKDLRGNFRCKKTSTKKVTRWRLYTSIRAEDINTVHPFAF